MQNLFAAQTAVFLVTAHICCVSESDHVITERTAARTTLPLSRSAALPRILLQIVFAPPVQMSCGSDEPRTNEEHLAKVRGVGCSVAAAQGESARGRQ